MRAFYKLIPWLAQIKYLYVCMYIVRNLVISGSVRAAHVRVQERRRQDGERRRCCKREGQLRALSLDRRRQRDHCHRRLQSSESLH